VFRKLHPVLKKGGLLSVFPMHLGTAKFMEIINALGCSRLETGRAATRIQIGSEIINFTKL